MQIEEHMQIEGQMQIEGHIREFINRHIADDINSLALQRKRYCELSDLDWQIVMQQIEGRQRSAKKLPTLCQINDWIFPAKLSIEQCSSEQTAAYKRDLLLQYLPGRNTLADLTGGYGIDTWFLSEIFTTTHYVERQSELAKIAEHNFAFSNNHIIVHNTDAHDFLSNAEHYDCIYIDPARRSKTGGKVFRLEDCEPDITAIYLTLLSKCDWLLLKLSPMLDITTALRSLPETCLVCILAVDNEVREMLVLINANKRHEPLQYSAVNISAQRHVFNFKAEEERNASCVYADASDTYIYEPNVAIMKVGAFKLIAEQYGISKLSKNTHLYTSDRLIADFQGRAWKVLTIADKKLIKGMSLNVLSRNYPLSAEQIRAKYHLRESDKDYLIATKIADNNCMLLAERIY